MDERDGGKFEEDPMKKSGSLYDSELQLDNVGDEGKVLRGKGDAGSSSKVLAFIACWSSNFLTNSGA